MRYGKPDANKAEIVEFFEKVGGYWQDCYPDQGHDGYLFYKHHIFAVEIKDGAKSPSRQALTDDEKKFKCEIEQRGVPLWIIRSIEDARALIEFRFGDIKET